jgi:hypothetical protein
MAKTRTAIKTEAERVHESTMYSAQGQFEQAKIWNRKNLILGIPASGVAGIAGVTGLATSIGKTWVSILALIAAFLSGIMTTLNYSKKIDQAHASANAYLALQQDARIFIDIDLDNLDEGAARDTLGNLVARQQEINTTAQIPSPTAYKRAKANIESGGQTYEADKNN